MFISFEGAECCGKTTQINILALKLRESGYEVITTREPGGTAFGEDCRNILKHTTNSICPEAELLLMNASRAQLVRDVIRPALEANMTVICDRYFDSTTAYQQFGRKLDGKMVSEVIRCAVGSTVPDITFLLEASEEYVSARMRASRGQSLHDRFEAEGREFFDRVNAGFKTLAEHNSRFRVINADLPIAMVADQIWAHLEKSFDRS